MNVTIEEISACRKRLRIEVPADRVNEEFDKVAADYSKHARIPGFRPGKAPKGVILKKYQKEIESELQRTLVPKAYREAFEKRNLNVVSYPDVESVSYQPGLSLSFSTLIDVAPEFALPNYKGLTVKGRSTEITEDDVTKAKERLLSQYGKFVDAPARPIQAEDIAVLDYKGTVDGKAIEEIAPQARQLSGGVDQWLLVRSDFFVPGFTDALIGLNINDKKTITVTIPDDAIIDALKGKSAVYEVEVKGIKVRELPEITDALSQQLVGVPAAEFETKLRTELKNEKEREVKAEQRKEIGEALIAAVDFELPESVVKDETRDIVQDIVSENQSRGIPAEVLEEKKQEIFDNAAKGAKETVKLQFILRRIAEEEKITVTQDQVANYVTYLAYQSGKPVEKFVKELSDKGGFAEVQRRLLSQNVIDFLLGQANVVA
ncbi:trigger factor [Verrucomicrobium sp. GAS474]|uniref:trigger factor n=1 Tax=Verrucomicrobium sp. GAS474 TaxID=1882831 RepID=UPI00087996C6|nr:trigger factor [Verrucomicrobium sp. GAS474]SDU22222.1 trigger factor [Verrucomicrobium sp. GAS474]